MFERQQTEWRWKRYERQLDDALQAYDSAKEAIARSLNALSKEIAESDLAEDEREQAVAHYLGLIEQRGAPEIALMRREMEERDRAWDEGRRRIDREIGLVPRGDKYYLMFTHADDDRASFVPCGSDKWEAERALELARSAWERAKAEGRRFARGNQPFRVEGLAAIDLVTVKQMVNEGSR